MALARRHMASLATKNTEISVPQVEATTTTSGLKIASIDSDTAAVSTLAVMVKAGPIYESYDNLGVSHALRISAGLATKNATSFGIIRNIQQSGGQLNVTATREYMLYSLSCPRNLLSDTFIYFNEVVTSPAFKPWEVKNIPSRLALDVASIDIGVKATELLHKAAYRNGLGNSLYTPEFMLGKHKSNILDDFYAKTHTVTRSVLLGHGIESREMAKFSNLLNLEKGHGLSPTSKYYGGEERSGSGGNLTCVAIAGETAPSRNSKDAIAAMLLKNILGSGSNVKYGNGNGKLGKALATIDGEKAVSGINYAYQDSSLTGAFILCDSNIAGKVVPEVVTALRSLVITPEELAAAKKSLVIEHSENKLNSLSNLEALGVQTLFGTAGEDLETLLSMTSLSDVQAVAKRITSGKLSMAAAGNLKNVPYIDTL